MFKDLPMTADAILAMEWSDYEPYFKDLQARELTASNLDEFTAVRVGSLMLLVAEGSAVADAAGQTPREQLQTLRQRIRDFTDCQYRCFLNDLEPALAAAGLKRLHAEQLTERQLKVVEQLFDQDIFPIFTPMAINLPFTLSST